ncbi:MAG: hypothetical protein H7X88_07790 [Gloeobacteraceae cyanobacterium ES-bin-316]|nr:hypothetical protein [Ferruginibacter sp.]
MKMHMIWILLLSYSITSYSQTGKGNTVKGEWLTAAKDVRILIDEEAGKYFGKVTWGNRDLGKDKKIRRKQKGMIIS